MRKNAVPSGNYDDRKVSTMRLQDATAVLVFLCAMVALPAVDPTRQIGWFVGWATRGESHIVFARLIQDESPNTVRAGWRARDSLLRDLPSLVD